MKASDSISRATDRQELYRQSPDKIYPHWLPPCTVGLLMVTDSGGSFGAQDFGLDTLVDILTTGTGPWARVDVTTAHRRNDPIADLQDFRFDEHDLNQYDQIWLVGVERSGGLALTDKELRALSEFMDGGGGVFATGDHEDLGVSLCGAVPRVRSMRKWYYPGPGPLGEPVAPPGGGPDRLDTLSAGGDPGVQFDDQSDDVPQVMSPTMYSNGSFSKYFYRVHPHPVLCGPRGVIRVLPDHPHEGECYVPDDLAHSFTLAGYATEEYPALPIGGRLAPEVIAWSHISGGRTAKDVKGVLNPRTFGAIGVWDGHRVDRGRVLVQATWHHIFNINLVGELGNANPVKAMGFETPGPGQAVFEEIKTYFRNVAIWLARPDTINCIRWRAAWWLRWHHLFVMDLRPHHLANVAEIELEELTRVGSAARDVLGRYASQCESLKMARWPIKLVRKDIWEWLEPYADPWSPSAAEREVVADPVLLLQAERFIDAALGATIYTIAAAFPDPSEEARDRALQVAPQEVLAPAVDVALRRVAQNTTELAGRMRDFGGQLG